MKLTLNKLLALLTLISVEVFSETLTPNDNDQGTLIGGETLVSPDKRYKLEGYFGCYYKLTNIETSEVIVDESGPETYKYCSNLMGFSHDSSLFYLYDQNSLYIYIFDVLGNLMTYQKVATEPYIEAAIFAEDDSYLTVKTSHNGTVKIQLIR